MSITINGQIIRVRIGVGQQVVDVRINDGWLQIKYNFTGWINYINIDDLKGSDGREIELSTNNGFVVWRYVGDTQWTNLVELSSLKGPQGEPGPQGIQGPEGPQGIQGPKGDQGDSAELEKGSISPSTVVLPTEDGIYAAEIAGTYNNIGGLVAKPNFYTQFELSGGVWSLYREVEVSGSDVANIIDVSSGISNLRVDGNISRTSLPSYKTIAGVIAKDWTTLRKISLFYGFGTLTSGTTEVWVRVFTTNSVSDLNVVARELYEVTIPGFQITAFFNRIDVTLPATVTNAGAEYLCVQISSNEGVNCLLSYSPTLLANNIQMAQNKVGAAHKGPTPTNAIAVVGTSSNVSYIRALITPDLDNKEVIRNDALRTNVLDFGGILIRKNYDVRDGNRWQYYETVRTYAVPVFVDLTAAKSITIYLRLSGQLKGQKIPLRWEVFNYFVDANNQVVYDTPRRSILKTGTVDFVKNNVVGDFTPLKIDVTGLDMAGLKTGIYITAPLQIAYLTSGNGKLYDGVNYPSVSWGGTYNATSLGNFNQGLYLDKSEILCEVEYASNDVRGLTPEAVSTIDLMASKYQETDLYSEMVLPREINNVVNNKIFLYRNSIKSLYGDAGRGILFYHTNIVPFDNRGEYSSASVQVFNVRVRDMQSSHEQNLLINNISRTGGTGNKTVLLIGDSLTVGANLTTNKLPVLLRTWLTADEALGGATFTMIGRHDQGNGARHEGNSGWRWSNYLAQNASNPFWDAANSVVSLKKYCQDLGVALPDIIPIYLGTNDIDQGTAYYDKPNEQVAAMVANSKLFINAMLDPVYGNPNAKIIIMTIPLGSLTAQKNWFADLAMRLNSRYIQEYDFNSAYPNVYVGGLHFCVDRYDDYPFTDVSSGAGSSTTYREQNQVHYNDYGGLRVATRIYGEIRKAATL